MKKVLFLGLVLSVHTPQQCWAEDTVTEENQSVAGYCLETCTKEYCGASKENFQNCADKCRSRHMGLIRGCRLAAKMAGFNDENAEQDAQNLNASKSDSDDDEEEEDKNKKDNASSTDEKDSSENADEQSTDDSDDDSSESEKDEDQSDDSTADDDDEEEEGTDA